VVSRGNVTAVSICELTNWCTYHCICVPAILVSSLAVPRPKEGDIQFHPRTGRGIQCCST